MENPDDLYDRVLDNFDWGYSIIVAPKKYFRKEKIQTKLSDSFKAMTCNLCLDSAYSIDLPNQDLMCVKHYDLMEDKGNFKTIDKIWQEINLQSDRLEKELLLVECIHSYWESKQNQTAYEDTFITEIDELFQKILSLLKSTVIDMSKVQEIFTLEMYSIWMNNFKKITNLFEQIHTKSGTALSYLMANKILDEVYYIAGDDSRLTEVEKQEERLYGKSFDILSLIGAFEKPLGTHEKIKEKIRCRNKKVIHRLMENTIGKRMQERENEKEKNSSYEELKEQLAECHEFISSLRDIPLIDRGSEIVHFIKTHDLEKPPSSSVVVEALRKNNIDPNPDFGEDYIIDLDFKLNEEGLKFIIDTNDSKFANYRKLSLRNIYSLYSRGILQLNKFLDRSIPNVLQILYLHGGERTGKTILPDLIPALRYVKKQIYLDWFTIDHLMLKEIIEASWKVEQLVLNYIKVGGLPSTFRLEDTIDFNIQVLGLYGTISKDPEKDEYGYIDEAYSCEYINKSGFKILAKAMKNTSLKESLKKVHLSSQAISKAEAEKVFKFYGLNAKIRANKKWPECLI
ncbi:unnamed protein product [Moneuplotes crassus]|uniref:Uncharacterized protein n=1 Tax=Euplotes crassus TaxID=5936 RepID=A0AAD1U671_EUPCR|nr:unnamed protein product [Moneuplotes crassus]